MTLSRTAGNIKVVLICIDAGGGHRAAANALSEVIRAEGRPWDVETVSVQDLFRPIDFIRRFTGIPFEDVYNIMLRRGWTLGSGPLIRLMHLLIRQSHSSQTGVLGKYWSECRPDLVVSLIPHYNRALRQSLRETCPDVPFVTVLTDIVDYPPHFWIENQDQFVICGSERAAAQARALGVANDRIVLTSGMILNPRFYSDSKPDRAAERIRLGLDPALPTGLVLYGGEGSRDMVRVGRALNRADSNLQLLFVCGRNEQVRSSLREIDWKIPVAIEGFTREIPARMEISDFLIGKPGPGTLSEALAKQLPVIVFRNRWTLAHERCNADWIADEGLGVVVRRFSELPPAVSRLLDGYPAFRSRVSRIQNRAVFEIPEILDAIRRRRLSAAIPREFGHSPSRSVREIAHSV